LQVTIGADGQPRLELKLSSAVDAVDKTLQKAVVSKSPFPPPPGGKAEFTLVVEDGELSIE
jgi:hypothetical protein